MVVRHLALLPYHCDEVLLGLISSAHNYWFRLHHLCRFFDIKSSWFLLIYLIWHLLNNQTLRDFVLPHIASGTFV
jgi:hypothetical protein